MKAPKSKEAQRLLDDPKRARALRVAVSRALKNEARGVSREGECQGIRVSLVPIRS